MIDHTPFKYHEKWIAISKPVFRSLQGGAKMVSKGVGQSSSLLMFKGGSHFSRRDGNTFSLSLLPPPNNTLNWTAYILKFLGEKGRGMIKNWLERILPGHMLLCMYLLLFPLSFSPLLFLPLLLHHTSLSPLLSRKYILARFV